MTEGKREPEMRHVPLAPRKAFEGLVARVLTSSSEERGVLEMPVPPSGAIYLNALVRGKVDFRFRNGARREAAPDLYFGGQLVRDIPRARIATPLTLAGLQFTASGFYRLFRADASTFTDGIMPLDNLDPALAAALRSALSGVQAATEAADILQDLLEERLATARPPGLSDRAAARIESRSGRIEVSELARTCGVSPRHLRRIFVREVGIAPKSYAKVVQLNSVIAALQANEPAGVHEVALAHGYYDQAHFARDFTRLIGTRPTDFLESRDAFLEMFLGRRSEQ